MKNSMCRVSLIVVTLLGTAVSYARDAEASLISTDWLAPGDGLVTIDTATGLRWLDITVTTSLSYNYVSTQFGTGGQFAGWGYANDAQVSALFSDAGVPEGFFNSSPAVSANALSFIRDYFGTTYGDPTVLFYVGFQGLLNGTNDTSGNVTGG